MSLLVPLVLFGLLWALLILPQQRRARAQQEMQNNLQPGDQVVTSAGIYGQISEVDGDTLLVEVAPGIELRIAKSAIGRRIELLDEAEADADFDADLDAELAPPPDAGHPAVVDEFAQDLEGDSQAPAPRRDDA